MRSVVFHLQEETGRWEAEDMQIYENKKTTEWSLIIGNVEEQYVSIYEVIAILYNQGIHATFRLSDSAQDVPSKCW